MLCSVYGATDDKKNRNKCGWKMAMPFNYTNHLSHDCVNASSVNMFKNKIDNSLARAGIPRLNT